MTSLPTTTYSEDIYTFHWQEEGIQAVVERFVEEKTDIRAELTVTSDHPTHGGQLYYGRLLLMGPQARAQVRNALSGREPETDWGGMLEQVCTLSVRRYREGAPAVDLWTADLGDGGKYLVSPFVFDDAVNIVYGAGDAGKSLDSLLIAIAVATGEEVAGLIAERSGPVLYLDWEDTAATHQERLRALCVGLGVDLGEGRMIYRRMDASLVEGAREARKDIAKYGAVMVIVDSLGMACGGDPSDAGGIIRTMLAARSLGVPVVCIHHIAKDAKDKSTPYGCYSEDTELLTRSGWKRHTDYSEGEEVLAYNPEDESFRWEVPTAVHVYPYEGDMHLYRKRSLNALVTPNHRMLVQPVHANRSGRKGAAWKHGEWQFRRSEELNATPVWFPGMGVWPEEGEEVSEIAGMPADPVIQLLGWFVSEGSWNDNAPVFTQGVGELADAMRGRLDAIGAGYNTIVQKPKRAKDTQDIQHLRLRPSTSEPARAFRDWLRQAGKGAAHKRIPDEVSKWSRRQRMLLLDSLMEGDGHWWNETHGAYTTISPELADQVQILALSLGYGSSVRLRGNTRAIDIHRVRRPRLHVKVTERSTRTAVPYAGTVYCLTVPSGAYLTRREGKPLVAGNSVYASNEARMSWLVESEREGSTLTQVLTNYKANRGARHERQSFRYDFHSDERDRLTRISVVPLTFTQSKTVGDGGQKWRIADELKSGARTLDAIAEALDITKATAKTQLYRHKNLFVRLDSGLWALVDTTHDDGNNETSNSEYLSKSLLLPSNSNTRPPKGPVLDGVTNEEEEEGLPW